MNAIVVTDRNWAIGKDNCLLFSLPTDMKHFRAMTMNGTVLMGRKTLESFPGGKPLPAAQHRHHPGKVLFQRGRGSGSLL